MPFNYRVLKQDTRLAIFEVYYRDGRPYGQTLEPFSLYASTVEELRIELARVKASLDESVLSYNGLEPISEELPSGSDGGTGFCYRVLKKGAEFAVFELRYKGERPIAKRLEPCSPFCRSVEDLRFELLLLERAFNRPVLSYDGLKPVVEMSSSLDGREGV